MSVTKVRLSAIDLYCGAGGLSLGLREAGISVVAGIDIDPRCKYPFETNIATGFLEQDVRTVTGRQLACLWEPASIRILAGCPPCQPFSAHRRGADTSNDREWALLDEFGRLVVETRPDLVTMENVPRIIRTEVFRRFIDLLSAANYYVAYRSCQGAKYGLAQLRSRLVLVASQLGSIDVPNGQLRPPEYRTVRSAIGSLPSLVNGEAAESDPLHTCRLFGATNLERLRASKPGGTWQDWPETLLAPCHQRVSGSTFKSVYSRMEWTKPSPTITTQFFNFGTGRFGHPEQDRALSIREGAILQGFPPDYKFVRPGAKVEFAPLGRLIGNAVPPPMSRAIGRALIDHVVQVKSEGAD